MTTAVCPATQAPTPARRSWTSIFALLAVGGLLLACSRADEPAAGSPVSASVTPRFSILESIEQPEGQVLLRIHDSGMGNLPGGGVIRIPLHGPCPETSTVESMLNFFAAHTSEAEIGSISRVECGGDGFDVTTVNSMPCGCDFGKQVQVAQQDGGFTIVTMTDWRLDAPQVAAPAPASGHDEPLQADEESVR